MAATETSIAAAIDKGYGASVKNIGSELSEESVSEGDLQITAGVESLESDQGVNDEPIIKFCNAVLADAIRKKVSDIHFEPYEKRFRVRYRLDMIFRRAEIAGPDEPGWEVASNIFPSKR